MYRGTGASLTVHNYLNLLRHELLRHLRELQSRISLYPICCRVYNNSGLPVANSILGHKILGHFFKILGRCPSNLGQFNSKKVAYQF